MEEAERNSLGTQLGFEEEEELEEWISLPSQELLQGEMEYEVFSEELSSFSIPSTIKEVPEEEEVEEEETDKVEPIKESSVLHSVSVGILSKQESSKLFQKEKYGSIHHEAISSTLVPQPIIVPPTTIPLEEHVPIADDVISEKELSRPSTESTHEEPAFLQMFEDTRVGTLKQAEGEGEKVDVTINCSNGQRFKVVYFFYTNIAEVKEDMVKQTGFSSNQLLLSLPDGRPLGDWLPLAALVTPGCSTLEIYLTFCLSLAGDEIEEQEITPPCLPLLKERHLTVMDAFGRDLLVNLTTEHINYTKEWLGGYRDKVSGKIYHHAATMTNYNMRCKSCCSQTSRQAQTHLMVDIDIQLDRQHSVQTYTPDIFQDPATDIIVLPKPYIEFDPINNPKYIKEDQAARLIQRSYRNYRSKQRAYAMFTKLIEQIKFQRGKKRKLQIQEIYEDLELKRTLGTLFPRHRKDFFYLYVYIGNWWKKEYKIIKEMENPYEKMADCMLLLKREIDWLFLLETKRIKSKNASLFRRKLKVIEDSSRPIINKTLKRTTVIETIPIQRAKEIKEVYVQLRRRDLSSKERIEGLMKLMENARNYEDGKGSKLASLISREIDLLTLDITPEYLEGIRKRIEEEIVFMANDKQFSPQGQNYRPAVGFPIVKIPPIKCTACGKTKHVMQFSIHTRMKVLGHCLSCNWKHEMNHEKINMAPYEFILMCLRRKEVQSCPTTMYPFLVQPLGASFIVSVIWNRKSAISESDDVGELRMTRWEQKIEWTPWNNIVLTEEECDYHDTIENNEEVYSDEFIQFVQLKNLKTKANFIAVQDIATFAQYSGMSDRNMYVGSALHFKSRKIASQSVNEFLVEPPFKTFTHVYKKHVSPPCRNLPKFTAVKDLIV